MTNPRARVIQTRQAGEDHQVLTTQGGKGGYCKKPCLDCPWRKDATGVFPPEAFRHSARTAYDIAEHTFACHQAGPENPKLCAGFLLRGADNNLSVRMKRMAGKIQDDVTDAGHELHASYRDMAITNGVDPEDPVLAKCR